MIVVHLNGRSAAEGKGDVQVCLLESFITNDESDYEHEIWKKVLKSMRKVSNS